MFLFHEHDESGPYAIQQSSHAWLAWQIASHWGNRRFARPAPRAEVLAAVLLHDVGWSQDELAPEVDATGRPETFDTMPVDRHLKIWRNCVNQAAGFSRYAAVLVASHFADLAERKTTAHLEQSDTTAARSVQAFRAEMERLQAGWAEELSVDARYQQALTGCGRETNTRVLAACDMISVVLCAELPSPFNIQVVGDGDSLEEVLVTKVSDRVFRMNPWPLEGDRLKIHLEAHHLRTTSFRSTDAYRKALSTAPVERFAFTLMRPSAK
jgi:hypothetical protein